MNNVKTEILYVEDNPHNMLLIQRLLKAEGFMVHGAENADEALDFVNKQIPALILMDMNLPFVDGFTITKKMRQMPALANIPIIALTANVLKGDKERIMAAGCDGYIQKPIDIDRLPKQIRSFLK